MQTSARGEWESKPCEVASLCLIHNRIHHRHVCSTCWNDFSGVFDFDMLWHSDNYFWNITNYQFETISSFWHLCFLVVCLKYPFLDFVPLHGKWGTYRITMHKLIISFPVHRKRDMCNSQPFHGEAGQQAILLITYNMWSKWTDWSCCRQTKALTTLRSGKN